MDFKIVKCQDFGEIKIQKDTTYNQIEKYTSLIKNDPILAVDSLIAKVIIDKTSIKDLTDIDKINILSEISMELEFIEFFNEQISNKVPYYTAFNNAFEKSDVYECLSKPFKGIESMIIPSIEMAKFSQTLLNNYSGILSIQEAFKAISKNASPVFSDWAKMSTSFDFIRKSVSNYNTINKSLFPLTNQLLMSKILEQQRMFDQTKAFQDIYKISSFSIEHLKSISIYNKRLFESISILSKRNDELNAVFAFSDGALKNIKSSLDFIKSSSQINWLDQLNNTTKIINSCNIAISSTNDYFVGTQSIEQLVNEKFGLKPDEIKEFGEITSSVRQSENIIQDKGGSSIIIQKEFAQILFDKIDSLEQEMRGETQKYKRALDHFEQFLRPQAFSDFLDEFAIIVSREYWRQFWQNIGYTLKPAPESIAKSNLGMFLSGRYSNIAFIGQELVAGNGYVDLLVNYVGINYLIELKVIGATVPISWAKSGIDQLNNYMGRYNLDNGYLVIYDGRKTVRGEQLADYYDVSNGRIYVKKIKIFFSE